MFEEKLEALEASVPVGMSAQPLCSASGSLQEATRSHCINLESIAMAQPWLSSGRMEM